MEPSTRDGWESLAEDLARLVRAHVELVQLEGREAFRDLVRGGVGLLAGAAAVAGALLFLPTLLALVLAQWLAPWLAGLVSWCAVAALGAGLALWGWRRLRRPKLPRVREALQEDARWIRELTASMRSSGRPGSGSP
ncbi:MAG: phage holin family protein [bacterium]